MTGTLAHTPHRTPTPAVLVAPAPAYRDVDWHLSPSTLARVEKAPAASTLRAYRKWITEWRTWCDHHGRIALPATPHTLTEWVSHLCDLGTGLPSLRLAVAAVRFLHATSGHEGEPAGKLARMVARTHARTQAVDGARTKQAAPILTADIPRLLDACDPTTLRGARDRFVLAVGWGGLLRRSEIANLTFRDVRAERGDLLTYIAWSKTDQQGHGATVTVPNPLLDKVTDPVQVWRDYVAALAARGETSGHLVRSIETGGRLGSRISGHGVNELVRDLVRRAGLPEPERYTAHSLRAGGATSMHEAGAKVSQIAEQGRWSPSSPVVLAYIRAVDRHRDNPMRGRALSPVVVADPIEP